MGFSLPLQFFVATLAGWLTRRHAEVLEYLKAENAVLREQLRGRLRLHDDQRRRLAVAAKPLGRTLLEEVATIAKPDTLLRWYRLLIARKYGRSGTAKRRTVAIADLVTRIARENPRFGYTRIRDALRNLGHEVGRTTIARILAQHGLDPAPRRSSWKEFLAAHWGVIAAADFFAVEVLTWGGLVRYHVLVL